METESSVYGLALSYLKDLKPGFIKKMVEAGASLPDFFEGNLLDLSREIGLNGNFPISAAMLQSTLRKASHDFQLYRSKNVEIISIFDDSYPIRLREISDPPTVLYIIGNTNLNGEHTAAIVGTRKPSPYGTDFCTNLVADLAVYFPDLTIVSGMAFGIDACAHKASLATGRTTIGVMAHGLDMIYPAAHRDLARNIIRAGGAIISEYPFGEKPFRQRFLERNRIVAALSDVTVVVESKIKGGAMSTANTAFSYSREVMALPGRISDTLSEGCNHLIRKEKARLITCAADLIEATGWKPAGVAIDAKQRNLFPELEGDGKTIYELLRFSREPLQVDQIFHQTQIPMARLVATLGELEFDGILIKYPGNRYTIS